MDARALKTIFQIGETIAVEFKRCGNRIENDTYETVCSFLNRFGGDLFLGVLDDGTVQGVSQKAAPDLVKNFISSISNPAMFFPTIYLVPEIVEYEGRTIIHVHIPPGAEVHSFKKVIYDRVDDADVKVTSTAQIAQMYIRKQDIFTERKIYPYVRMEDLRLDMLPKLRIMAANNSGGQEHPWRGMSDEELLKSSRLYGTDRATGEQGYNLAAVMLLGKDDVILDVVPAYLTDALLRRANVDRYDDREIIRTNLIESYERLMEFGRKHLPDKFFLEDDQRKSLRNIITREIIANTLIHREYTSSFQAKFVIEKDRMYVENANRSAQMGVITPDNIEPNPKNPIIASFFRNIGYAEQLGSGVRNLFKYSKYYSGKEPEFIEGDIFKIVVPLEDGYGDSDEFTTQSMEKTTQSAPKTTQSAPKTTQSAPKTTQSTTRLRIIKAGQDITELLRQEPELSQKQIAQRLDLNVNTVKYYIKKMQEQGKIHRIGSSRKGKWIISDR
ncbi:MAG: putative DNA binding domain-containing protein [Lachnospiraceae bacterium]|nr:putative DNA binding domain-containing protein [Lachnospiraceae bacterium]